MKVYILTGLKIGRHYNVASLCALRSFRTMELAKRALAEAMEKSKEPGTCVELFESEKVGQILNSHRQVIYSIEEVDLEGDLQE